VAQHRDACFWFVSHGVAKVPTEQGFMINAMGYDTHLDVPTYNSAARNHEWLAALAQDIAQLHAEGRDLLVVSSGAVALGRTVLSLEPGPLKLEDRQAAAAIGQISLARTWTEVLGHHGITAGQVLVTLQDTEERRRYLNARSTIGKLMEWRAVPVSMRTTRLQPTKSATAIMTAWRRALRA
jgi:hypothetical protein